MASVQNYLFKRYLRFLRQTLTTARKENDINFLRRGMEAATARLKIPDAVHFSRFEVAGIPAARVKPKNANPDMVLFYLHGGGYALGSIDTHKSLVARIAQKAGTYALTIDYRLAPEHPYPAALNDAIDAYKWLLEKNYQPKNIVIAGDSAGGGLTLATLLKLKALKLPLPAAAVCLSPWTDLMVTGKSVARNVKEDPMFEPRFLRHYAKLYAGQVDRKMPYLSPVYGDLTGLPPMLVQVGTSEIILDDSTRIAERAADAGVDVTLEIWQDMMHVWQVTWPYLDEADDAIDHIAAFIKHKVINPSTEKNISQLKRLYIK